MRACLFLALLVATAAADPLGDYRAAVRRLGKQERKYWSDSGTRGRETLMKGLAEVSGGSYVWLKAPEKR